MHALILAAVLCAQLGGPQPPAGGTLPDQLTLTAVAASSTNTAGTLVLNPASCTAGRPLFAGLANSIDRFLITCDGQVNQSGYTPGSTFSTAMFTWNAPAAAADASYVWSSMDNGTERIALMNDGRFQWGPPGGGPTMYTFGVESGSGLYFRDGGTNRLWSVTNAGLLQTYAGITAGNASDGPFIGGTIALSSTADIRGAISNGGASNGGQVYINDAMEVVSTATFTGQLAANSATTIGGMLITSGTADSFSSNSSNTMTTSSLTTAHVHHCSCTSGTNCPVTVGAPAVTSQVITIVQITAQQCVIQASSGTTAVVLPAGAATLTMNAKDTLTLRYITGAGGWITESFSDNSP